MSNTDDSDENSENVHLLTFQLPIYITCNRRMRLLGYKKGNLSVIKSLRSTVTKSHSNVKWCKRRIRKNEIYLYYLLYILVVSDNNFFVSLRG